MALEADKVLCQMVERSRENICRLPCEHFGIVKLTDGSMFMMASI